MSRYCIDKWIYFCTNWHVLHNIYVEEKGSKIVKKTIMKERGHKKSFSNFNIHYELKTKDSIILGNRLAYVLVEMS